RRNRPQPRRSQRVHDAEKGIERRPWPALAFVARRPKAALRRLQQLQVHSRGLAVTAALEVVADLLAFDEGADAGLLEGRHVDERVLAAIFRSNEAEALGRIEELYGSVDHLSVTFEVNARRFRR